MEYKIYVEKPFMVMAKQQDNGDYLVVPYTVSKEGKIILVDGGEETTMPKEIFELNYEEVEDA